MSSKKIVVIGSGISSLSCASFLAKEGHEVIIIEQNESIGGRARQFKTENGFTFDMGPSWYWMPDIFENFYQQFGYTTSDFYKLIRLDPSYQVIWGEKDMDSIPASIKELEEYFETLEIGSSVKLREFLADAEKKYQIGMKDLVYKPSLKLTEFADTRIFAGLFKMHLFTSYASFIRKYFKNPKIISLLEFPILFLGATPKDTPALYSLMNYADIKLGTWYPMGGMFEFVKAFEKIAKEQGVTFSLNNRVLGFNTSNGKVQSITTSNGEIACDYVISGADYQHTEQLLKNKANYTSDYWEKRTMAPSCLLFYIGLDCKVPKLQHHNLFFDENFEKHAHEIYKDPKWPSKPLFYVSCPSKTDPSVAPQGGENLFLLIPIAPNLVDNEETREHYFQLLVNRLQEKIGVDIQPNIVYKRSYCIADFMNDYNAFKGNAYGLANTLKQTALLKPRIKNKQLSNLFYTGQLTVPGPGIPPSIISGEVVAKHLLKSIDKQH
ncbi:phytoene desaturase family protein [Fluviicola taffensis]|uniref:Phytoene desaturase n=1 Tax=Fluviicola taffensis (strain DSM 16823 / NCIMB 13979 / RW262) TaxID=755732 RepID=F2IK36_FLUTR|nr:phytoene desaturase family protein [Fluviicola taffensis]AEA42935.1 phytoene desaturase [Fluviicola taffensis DSM 16823]